MDILSIINSWVPAILSALIVVVLYVVAKYFLDKQANTGNFSLLRTMLLMSISLIGFLVIILCLPIDQTIKSQVTSLFGIVISAGLALSSATFIGNGLAGVMLRAVNNFKIGDFVEIGATLGRVSEKGLLHTEVQLENRDLVTLPNLYIATNPVRVIRASGTFVSSTVSLGYDVNQYKIKEALLKAAEEAGLSDAFVHVTALGDFSVVYKVFGLLKDAKTMLSASSKLNSCVLDALHSEKIEIVSPTFMNQRQVGDSVFIPRANKVSETVAEAEKAEALVFDKAEEAEYVEKKSESIEEIEAKLKGYKEKLSSITDATEKEILKDKISRTITIIDSQKSKLTAIKEDLDKKE